MARYKKIAQRGFGICRYFRMGVRLVPLLEEDEQDIPTWIEVKSYLGTTLPTKIPDNDLVDKKYSVQREFVLDCSAATEFTRGSYTQEKRANIEWWLQDFSVTVKRRGRSELLESPDRTQMTRFGKIIHKRPTYAKKSRIPVGPTDGNKNEVCPNINADAFTPIGVLKNIGARVIYDGISEDPLDEF